MTPTLAPVEHVRSSAFTVPTDAPESDGTLEWSNTTLVLVELRAGGERGYGWTYSTPAAARLVDDALAPVVVGADAGDVPRMWRIMRDAVRNVGRCGIATAAISAVDVALWDLAARMIGCSVLTLLGRARDAVDAYGSGGFCSYTAHQLERQLGGWAEAGFAMVKMKVGREPQDDPNRVAVARKAVGDDVQVFVDANGAYTRKEALALGAQFAELGVTWFEEPVPYDDLAGLRFVREHAPGGMEIAAGEYSWNDVDEAALLDAGAVDVCQIDGTRCGGVTGFLQLAALCDARRVACSAHTAPTIHAHVCCAVPGARHVEYFHDHARIERMFFDGSIEPREGRLRPDPAAPGFGVQPRWNDLDPYRTWSSA